MSSSSSSSEPPFSFSLGRVRRTARDFQKELDDIKESREQMGRVIAERRAANEELPEYRNVQEALSAWKENKDYQDIRNPYLGYKADAMKDLADVVGIHNLGIKFNPTFNSKESAEEWLETQLRKAYQRGDDKAVEKLERYRINLEDMDRDEGTVPNVVVYSDYANKRIKSIDGFSVVPRTKKEALRAQYDIYPTRQLRQDNMPKDSEEKKKLKAYFRKYPNPASWEHHKFDDFKVEPTTMNRLRDTYMKRFLAGTGFTIHSKNNPGGQLSVTHYMTIVQKTMSEVMRIAWLVAIPSLPREYDFKKDRFKVKTKARKRALDTRLRQPMTEADKRRLSELYSNMYIAFNPGTLLESAICTMVGYTHFATGPSMITLQGKQVPKSEIFNIVEEINNKSGEVELEITSKIDPTGKYDGTTGHYIYEIVDHTLVERERELVKRRPGVAYERIERPARQPKMRESVYNPLAAFASPGGDKHAPLNLTEAFDRSSSGAIGTPRPGITGKKKLEKEDGDVD
jgi:hypothetical protein